MSRRAAIPRRDPSEPSPLVRQIRKDATEAWPDRNKKEDGDRGDKAHQARKSDHNTGDAVDLTHDAASGASGDTIAAIAIRDPRVKYVIWNRRIYDKEKGPNPGWQPYGKWTEMPHDEHVHISIWRAARADTSPMAFSMIGPPPPLDMPGEQGFEDADPIVIAARRKAKRKAEAEARKAKSKSKSNKTSDATRTGVHVYDGEQTLMLGDKQWMAAHVESPHTGGGRVAQGSSTVFVGTTQLPFARQSDPTTDGRFVIDGQPNVLIG